MLQSDANFRDVRIAAVVPAFKVDHHVVDVVRRTLPFVSAIFVVDDACPNGSGDLVEKAGLPGRIFVLRHSENRGVGGAIKTGYAAALKEDFDIIVKVDGDGQMAPELIPTLVRPLILGEADYVKGNRFFNPDDLAQMPLVRLIGNACLSLVSKASSGYWDIMDPTNGYTAIHRTALATLPLEKIADRYFFESDMLFRLNVSNAVVQDMPMRALYADEVSNLNVSRTLMQFPKLYIKNFFKRLFYNYLIRDFNAGSIQGLLGTILLMFGVIYGMINWISHGMRSEPTPLGTIMVAALPIILGMQLLVAALAIDVASVPKRPLQRAGRNPGDDVGSTPPG
jgi:dolichol-phosphate mannosyltransferase